jgi:hypothetical protein
MEKPPGAAAALNPANEELDNLPPAARAVRARGIINEAKAVYAEVGDAAIVEALRHATYDQVARELGVSTSAINKAVSRHRARERAGNEQAP